jgi:hypothetical protein
VAAARWHILALPFFDGLLVQRSAGEAGDILTAAFREVAGATVRVTVEPPLVQDRVEPD